MKPIWMQSGRTFLIVTVVACIMACIACGRVEAGAVTYRVIDLGPATSSVSFSQARGISDGVVLGNIGAPNPGNFVFWTGGRATSATPLQDPVFDPTSLTGDRIAGAELPAAGVESAAILSGPGFRNVIRLNTGSGYDWTTANAAGRSGGAVGQAQSSAGPDIHALYWPNDHAAPIDLHVSGFFMTSAVAMSGDRQFGSGWGDDNKGPHALMWRGSAASVVDLSPTGYVQSEIAAADGSLQLGNGGLILPGRRDISQHALLWSGTAEGVVDLNPPGYNRTTGVAIANGHEAGFGGVSGPEHALAWDSTAQSVVDLHTFLPPGKFLGSEATAIDANGDVVGFAYVHADQEQTDAILWLRQEAPSGIPLPAAAVPGLMMLGAMTVSFIRRGSRPAQALP